jgi:mannose-6-phosphate isomerase-like protein (cupin superfamily)
MTGTLQVTLWAGREPPTHAILWKRMTEEGLRPYSWSNGPHDEYDIHSHKYNKVIYVVQGSVTFGLPDEQRQVTLNPGDRLDLPAGTRHDATIGAQGVVCLEAHL